MISLGIGISYDLAFTDSIALSYTPLAGFTLFNVSLD
ncbi:MAG: hypothetical protein [Malazfec virus 1]